MATPPIPTEPLPLAAGREGATVRVHPLRTASGLAPLGFLQRPSGRLWRVRGLGGLLVPRSRWMRIPLPCFLVEHPAGPFMVDTGFHASVASDPKPNLGVIRHFLTGLQMDASDAAPAQVRARDVEPDAIRLVLMTHLHYDHASGAAHFPDARFLVERREWEAAHARGFHGYHRPHLDPALAWRSIDVAGEADLFGDGSVRLLHTPGHSKGHLSLLLRLEGGMLLLTGDAAFARRTLAERLVPMPPLVDDLDAYLASLDRLIALAGEADHVVTGHDPEGLDRHDGVFG